MSQGSTIDTRSNNNSDESSMILLQENNFTQQELSLAHVINNALAMKLDISPTVQTNRDLLNCLHFLQYAIDHQINDFEKADIIKARTGRDITKSILLERENKVD